MTFARLVLTLSALVFVGLGVAFAAAPAEMASLAQIRVRNPTARADIRATYGGFQLGFGAFLFVCLRRKEWLSLGLLANTFALAGFALARGGSALFDGPVSEVTFGLLAAETSGTVLSLIGWRLAPRDEPHAAPVQPEDW